MEIMSREMCGGPIAKNKPTIEGQDAMQGKMREYLGDGVYADTDGFAVILTTENGVETTNSIYLEPTVLEALARYVKRLPERISNAKG